jgi:hypothetical protein
VGAAKQGIGYRVQGIGFGKRIEDKVKGKEKRPERKMNFNEMAENIGLDEQDFRDMA